MYVQICPLLSVLLSDAPEALGDPAIHKKKSHKTLPQDDLTCMTFVVLLDTKKDFWLNFENFNLWVNNAFKLN